MRALTCKLLLGLAVLTATPAIGQQLTQLGYVDMKTVLDNAPQVVAGRQKLDQEFRPRNDAVLADEQRLVDMEQQLNQDSVMREEERAELERQIRSLRRAINRRKEDLREEINFRANEVIKSLEETVEMIIQDIARQENYDLIVASGSSVMYHNPAIDITNKVLDRLQLEFDADQLELGGG